MQTQIFRKTVLGFMALGLTLSALAILSCGGDDDDEIIRQANLQGAAERPTPVSTSGSGSAVLTINDDRTQISYTLTYTGLTNVVQGHIHVGSADIAGPIILYLCANGTFKANAPVPPPDCPAGSSVTVTGVLTAANLIPRAATATTPAVNTFDDAVTQLLNGNTYTNVHTDDGVAPPNTGPGDFPGGEIRGQN
jgi:hypothetical protein